MSMPGRRTFFVATTVMLAALMAFLSPGLATAAPAGQDLREAAVRAQSYAQLDAASLGLAPSPGRATTMLYLRGDHVCYSIRWTGVEGVISARIVLREPTGTPDATVLTLFDGASRAGGKAAGCVRPVPQATLVALADRAPDHLVVLSTASAPAGALAGTLKPQLTTRPLPDGVEFVTGVAAAPDGTQWFTSFPGLVLRRIDPQGVTTTRDLSRPGDPEDLYSLDVMRAPGGVLWVSSGFYYYLPDGHRSGRITRVDDHGGSRAYPMPAGVVPRSMTMGPDGAVWFAAGRTLQNFTVSGVGRLSRDGTVRFWPVTGNGVVRSVITGSDGNVWFFSDRMAHGRITPSGQITRFGSKFPHHNRASGSAVIGADGAIWFPDGEEGIGRVSTDGKLTHTELDRAAQELPTNLFVDPDGTVWFTAYRSRPNPSVAEVGRLTPDGRLTRFYLPGLEYAKKLAPVPGRLIRVYASKGIGDFVRPPTLRTPG